MIVAWDWLGQNYIELIAAFCGIGGVWLTTRQNILCWPVALVNVILYIYIFYVSKLYADAGLQVFYLFMTLYGWYHWYFGGQEHDNLPVSRISKKALLAYLSVGIPFSFLCGYLLQRYTDASFPYQDSFVSIWGILGTHMMARKILEHWLLWIIVDLCCVGIYLAKGLYPTTILYFIFSLLAVYGFYQWKKDLNIQQA
jgi:nicotinamide mononucleotide transporter